MKPLRQKLNSRSGVSIILALFFLLVCATVSAVVVTAAGANADRIALRAQEQQAYLAVRSAADYFRSELSGQTYTGNQPEVEYNCYQAAGGETSVHVGAAPCGHPISEFKDYIPPEADAQPCKTLWALATLVTKAHLENGSESYDTGALTRSLVISAPDMPDVLVTLTMLDDVNDEPHRYDVLLTFEAVGADCAMHFTLGCTARPAADEDGFLIPLREKDGDAYNSGSYHEVSWHELIDGQDKVIMRDEPTTAQNYKNLYSVTWEAGRVIKGGASQ